MSTNYSDVKNYLHNDLGISKEYVEEVILKTVRDEVEKLFSDEGRLQVILERIVRSCIKRDEHKTLYHLLLNFDSLLDEKITKTVFNEVKSKLKIELVEEDEDSNVHA